MHTKKYCEEKMLNNFRFKKKRRRKNIKKNTPKKRLQLKQPTNKKDPSLHKFPGAKGFWKRPSGGCGCG